jgi:glycosyl transferase family 25
MDYIRDNYSNMNTDLDFIHKIVFINLDKRTDRLEEIQKELENIKKTKIHRLSAIEDEIGARGCTKSHIEVMKLALQYKWKNLLVLEDDIMFTNYDESIKILKKIYKDNPNFDVILLGGTFAEYDKDTYKLTSSYSTCSYLVNGHYYKKLLDVWEESLRDWNGDMQYFTDVVWHKLMKRDNWYIVRPNLIVQRPSYSDIEGSFKDYAKFYIET